MHQLIVEIILCEMHAGAIYHSCFFVGPIFHSSTPKKRDFLVEIFQKVLKNVLRACHQRVGLYTKFRAGYRSETATRA